MEDRPIDPVDTGDQPAMPSQSELTALFDADEADVAAGAVVPLEPVLARMRATAEGIRRERSLQQAVIHPPA